MIRRVDEIVGSRDRLDVRERAHERIELTHLDLFHVTRVTQQRLAERIAASLGLVAQLHAAFLAHVAFRVKVFFHGHDANRLVGAFGGRDGQTTRGTFRRVDSKYSK